MGHVSVHPVEVAGVVLWERFPHLAHHVMLFSSLMQLGWTVVAEVVVVDLMTYQVHLEVAHQPESVEHSSPQQQ